LSNEDREDPHDQSRHHRRALVGLCAIETVRADRLRDEHLRPLHQAKGKAQENERRDAAEPDPGQLGPADPPDEERVDHGHHAVRDHRKRDGPSQSHEFT
jgi:hypothetical protein